MTDNFFFVLISSLTLGFILFCNLAREVYKKKQSGKAQSSEYFVLVTCFVLILLQVIAVILYFAG